MEKQADRKHLSCNNMEEQIICTFEDHLTLKISFLKTLMTSVALLPCLSCSFTHSVLVPSYVCAFEWFFCVLRDWLTLEQRAAAIKKNRIIKKAFLNKLFSLQI